MPFKNPETVRAYQRWWTRQHPLNVETRRERKLLSNYGITLKDFDRMLWQQHFRCALCRRPFGDERPVVDHCHRTGRVRGLLHRRCNLICGQAADSAELLRLCAQYLRRFEKKAA